MGHLYRRYVKDIYSLVFSNVSIELVVFSQLVQCLAGAIANDVRPPDALLIVVRVEVPKGEQALMGSMPPRE